MAHIERHMQQLPVVIKKHFIGYLAILGIGLGVTALLWGFLYSLQRSGQLDNLTAAMMLFASFIVLALRSGATTTTLTRSLTS